MKSLLASLMMICSILVSMVSPASACNVKMGYANSCHTQYVNEWNRGTYGRGGHMDPRGWNGGRQMYAQPRGYARPMYAQPRAYAPRRPVVIVYGQNGAYRGTSVARTAAAPTVVVARQPTEDQITRVRVPCAPGWELQENGNCGRWVD